LETAVLSLRAVVATGGTDGTDRVAGGR
jgi:hypothetical protein